MKVVLFNGSPRKEGNTYHCLNTVMEELKSAGIDCEYVWIGKEKLQGCIACYKCIENNDQRCVIEGDKMNEYIQKILEADGIIIGSPTYFSDLTVATKALIERAGYATGRLLKNKVGATVVAVRRAGAVTTFDALNHFFLYAEMIIPGSCYWNMATGMNPGEVENDAEGMNIMKVLGENMAWLLEKTV